MKLLWTFTLILFTSLQIAQANSRLDKQRREFFHEKISEASSHKEEEKKQDLEILSVSKNVITGVSYDSGAGTKQVNCIEVKFKINGSGEKPLPYFYVYLYNSKKELVERLEQAMIKETTGSHDIDPSSFSFKAKKTYTVQFDYPNQTQFKYYLAVVGNDEGLSVEVKPGQANWKEFEFDEKDKILG